MLEAIEKVNRELGTTTAIITHNVVTAGMADRVIYMGDGRVMRIETQAERVLPGSFTGESMIHALDMKLLRDL